MVAAAVHSAQVAIASWVSSRAGEVSGPRRLAAYRKLFFKKNNKNNNNKIDAQASRSTERVWWHANVAIESGQVTNIAKNRGTGRPPRGHWP
jgi:hypothetical protein